MSSPTMNIEQIAAELKNFFRGRYLRKLAKDKKFIVRERKISAEAFVETMVFAGFSREHVSLQYISSLFADGEIIVSKESINKKISEAGENFLRAVFENLSKRFTSAKFFGKASKFTDVVVLDSTEVSLNKRVKDFEGKRNGTRCKIQAIYRLLSNSLSCEITKENQNDQSYKLHLDNVPKGSLTLTDLGYFCINNFAEIEKQGGKFISRFSRTTTLMGTNGKPIDLYELLKNSDGNIDMQVLIGKKTRFRCRLIAKRLEGESLKSRESKLARDARRSGKRKKNTTEADYWSVYVTNLEEETVEEVFNLYMLRWQIELFFKILKSKLEMDHIDSPNRHRAMITIYGKLIGLMALMILLRSIDDVEISLYKAISYYKDRIKVIYKSITTGRIEACANFIQKIKKLAKKSTTKKRPSSLEICGFLTYRSSA